jgi:predicted GNAT family acetyltransferase
VSPSEVRDNPARSRYELDVDGETAFALYRSAPGVVTIFHTEVPRHLRERGIGSILARGVMQDIRAKGLKIIPRCGLVAAFIRENPEFEDLLG